MKQKIKEKPYKTATKFDVCTHLQPIVKVLEDNGNAADRLTGIICDKGDGNILLVENEIDFKLIENHFELPDFIVMNEQKSRIVCSKCWCSLEKKVTGRKFNTSQKIFY
ncbi:hypothetical protein ACJJID_12715 [Microbulbifer sp. CnH-101-G]|uniref:hypothetical protein n=1 Tax=Microbulbifer sp. CnH-101-G TaxID=3243393 RepID=UPI004038FD6E